MASIYYQNNAVEVKYVSSPTKVPENDVAKLMYYLNCVFTAIQVEQNSDIQRFTNYNNWSYLSFDEQNALIYLCYKFSPDILEDKVFFENADLCRNSRNEFIEISEVRQQLLAANSILIAGQTHEVNKIMVYKREWMDTFYWYPMRGLVRKLDSSQPPAITHTSPSTPSHTSNYRSAPIVHQRSRKRSCYDKPCVAGFCCGLVFVLAAIVGLIVYITHQ